MHALTRRQACDLHYRPDFDGAGACRWNPCGDADRLVEILGVDQEVAAELLARLRERTIGHEPFAVAHPDAGRRRRWVQRVGRQILPARVKVLRELRRLPVTLLALAFAQGLLVTVNQQQVFHVSASTRKSNGERADRHSRGNNLSSGMFPEANVAVARRAHREEKKLFSQEAKKVDRLFLGT